MMLEKKKGFFHALISKTRYEINQCVEVQFHSNLYMRDTIKALFF